MLFTGIDWADDHHDVALIDASATVLAEFRINHDADGFADLHRRIASYEADPRQVFVAIETSHGLVIDELLAHRYEVYAINPKAADRYRDRFSPSGSKSDALDARCLADMMRTDRHKHRPLRLPKEDYQVLGRLCHDLRKLIEERTRFDNQLTACLKEYYPQALGLFGQPDSAINVAFLKKFPDPVALGAITREEFAEFFKDQKYTRPNLIERHWVRAKRRLPEPSAVSLRTGRMRMLVLLDQLMTLKDHILKYERQIQELVEMLPEHDTFSSLPGAGKRLVPEMTAALGPNAEDAPLLFADARSLARYSGELPCTWQSGKMKLVRARDACNKDYRRTFYDFAMASVHWSDWAKAYFQHCRRQGKRASTIYRCLAAKWIKIIYRLWKTKTRYDESYHVQQLKLRNISWAMAL